METSEKVVAFGQRRGEWASWVVDDSRTLVVLKQQSVQLALTGEKLRRDPLRKGPIFRNCSRHQGQRRVVARRIATVTRMWNAV